MLLFRMSLFNAFRPQKHIGEWLLFSTSHPGPNSDTQTSPSSTGPHTASIGSPFMLRSTKSNCVSVAVLRIVLCLFAHSRSIRRWYSCVPETSSTSSTKVAMSMSSFTPLILSPCASSPLRTHRTPDSGATRHPRVRVRPAWLRRLPAPARCAPRTPRTWRRSSPCA